MRLVQMRPPWLARLFVAIYLLAGLPMVARGAPVVPGTGQVVPQASDDFEDSQWRYIPNAPKSSQDVDERTRLPIGRSANQRWIEGAGRGHPDIVKRVATPEGGLAGSTGALLMQSLYTGVPQRGGKKSRQDDLHLDVKSRVGGYIDTSWSPNCVVRVYLPPFDQWEDRTGSSFGLRATVRGSKRGDAGETEPYWPGLFFKFNSNTDRRNRQDSAVLIVRASERGDFVGPRVTETGWWTLGMSFTPDGAVHFYGHPGVEDLSEQDHIASRYCYGFRCLKFRDIFFNVSNRNNGRSWSTPWVIDDPTLYVVRPGEARPDRVSGGPSRPSRSSRRSR